jgi:glycosyltransferase involved in cell wall biosynthesis
MATEQALSNGEACRESIELSIVMPCLNEARTLEACIRKAKRYLETHAIRGEVIVADNGSTDGSQELARRLGARVVDIDRRGYGAALAGGIKAARGRYIIMGDSDDSYDFSNLQPIVEKLREGYDLVMGNRFLGGIEEGAMPPLHRYFGNPFLTAVGRLLFKSPCRDFYCGQRGFTKSGVETLGLQTTGMEFALEMIVKATMRGLLVTEVPVTLKPDGRDRPPHLRSWRDGWRSLRFFLMASPRWLFLYPAIVLMLLGTLVGGWVLLRGEPSQRPILDVYALVYCAAALSVGFQLFTFSAFGKLFAIITGLHPRNPRVERWFASTRLEKWLVVGALLLAGGVGASIYFGWHWFETGLSNATPAEVLKRVIPAALAMTLGCQIVFSSFYFALLQAERHKLPPI